MVSRSLLYVWLYVCTLIMLAGCATPVDIDYDTARDFSRLHGYAWVQPPARQREQDPVLYNTLTDRRVHESVDRLLAARGYRRVDPASADFLVTYHLNTGKRLESDRFGYGYGYGWSNSGVMVGSGRDVYEVEEETLTVDMLDGRTRELIWRGALTERLDRYLTPQERTGKTLRQIREILMTYPPR
jgi:(2Fe-2S) ferredoxin